MRRIGFGGVRGVPRVALACVALLASGCQFGVLEVEGALERNLYDADTSSVGVSHSFLNADGVRTQCEMWLTSPTCSAERHFVDVLVVPGGRDLGNVGAPCAEGQEVWPLLRDNADVGLDDVSVFVLIGADRSGNGLIDLEDDGDTTAASRVSDDAQFDHTVDGVQLTLDVQGATTSGGEVRIHFSGAKREDFNFPGDRTCSN
jgi:hypothetical protein